MILHRFCSKEEYEKFMAGERLVNNKVHSEERGSATTAVGFCFFREDPENAKHWFSGIVDFDYCLTFLVPEDKVNSCLGRYSNWIKPGVKDGCVYLKEYCCTEYDNKTFKLLNASDKFREYAPNAKDIKAFVEELKKGKITIKI